VALIASGTSTEIPDLGSALKPLLRACEDQDRDLRAAAARALGAIGDGAGTAMLECLLRDPDPAVRIQAVHALGRETPRRLSSQENAVQADGAEETVDVLLPSLHDAGPGVRKAALSSLAALLQNEGVAQNPERRNRVLEQMLDAGFDGGGSQASHAAQALGRIDAAAAAQLAVERLGVLPTSAERRVAIEILAGIYHA